MSHNKLGDYIFRRMQKENVMRRNTHERIHDRMYLSSSDIQRYINDYFEYGIDYTGDDNISRRYVGFYKRIT